MCHGDGETSKKMGVHEGFLEQGKMVNMMFLEQSMCCTGSALNKTSNKQKQ